MAHYNQKTTPASLNRQVKSAKMEMLKAKDETYESRKEAERLRKALEEIAYTNKFDRLCDVEAFAVRVLEGEK